MHLLSKKEAKRTMLKTAHHSDGSPRKIHLGGWKRQHVDARDDTFRLKIPKGLLALPAAWDNRPICSLVEDQGELGSCTANMFAGLIESNEIKAGKSTKSSLGAVTAQVNVSAVAVQSNGNIVFMTTVVPPAPPAPTPTPTPAPAKLVQISRLFEYYATRKIEGTLSEDSGATIRDTIKAGATYGVADEAAWAYDIAKFTVNPPASVWTAAASHKVTSYHAITDGDLTTMKSALTSGYLVGFGFEVYDYFVSAEMARKGYLSLPLSTEAYQGGHAVCLVGYDDKAGPFPDGSRGGFLVRNSWGTNWGIAGYFWMSYAYVQSTRLASDFWIIQSSPV